MFEALRGGCDLPDDYDVGAVSRFLPALLLRASGHPHNFARCAQASSRWNNATTDQPMYIQLPYSQLPYLLGTQLVAETVPLVKRSA